MKPVKTKEMVWAVIHSLTITPTLAQCNTIGITLGPQTFLGERKRMQTHVQCPEICRDAGGIGFCLTYLGVINGPGVIRLPEDL